MINEFIFFIQTIVICCTAIISCTMGKEAIVAFVCMCCLLANFFVVQEIMLFGLQATSSDAFSIGATFGLNLLQEYYGPTIARNAIGINTLLLLFYMVVSRLHTLFIPALADSTHSHFHAILYHTPRIMLASITVYFIAQTIDYYLYKFLKEKLHAHFFLIRNYGSLLVSQLLDTVLFTYLGLYGIIEHPVQVIIISYIIKLSAIAGSTPFIALAGYYMKNKPISSG